MHLVDIEAAVARELAELAALGLAEVASVGVDGHGVAHVVEEHRLETRHAEGNVEQSVVDGGVDAARAHELGLGEHAATEAVVAHSHVGRRVGQLAHVEGEGRHGAHLPLVARRNVEGDIVTHS